jgi:uncharacterized membrane protein
MEMNDAMAAGPERKEMKARVTVGGHPLHAILTDFPIACFTLSVVWNFVALFVNDQPWYAMTFWTMLAGLIMVIPTALLGLMDYTKVVKHRHPGTQTAMIHMIINVFGTVIFFFSLLLRGGPGYLGPWMRLLTFALALYGISVLMLGAFFGGRLIYHHGIGVDPDGGRPVAGPTDQPVPSH